MTVVLFSTVAVTQAVAEEVPSSFLERVDLTPDLRQSLPSAKLPFDGIPYCGPVAVSNSLVWLSKNGFDRLAPTHTESPEQQGALAVILGKYMKTTYEDGTTIEGLLAGLSRYITDKGYCYRHLKYEGWEPHSKEFGTSHERPDLKWIKEGLAGKSAVWLKVGWYKYNSSSDQYVRFAGHFLTLVGYTKDSLIIHDSAPRVRPEVTHHNVKLELLKSGKLLRGKEYLSIPARGYYKLGGDLKLKDGADAGILEGAITLTM